MNEIEFKKLLNSRESEHLEFKDSKNDIPFDGKRSLCDYVVAIGNEGGGRLIIGVTDKIPRKISGTNAMMNIGKTKDKVFLKLNIRINIEELYIEGKRVVLVEIPSRPIGTPLKLDGVPRMRIDENLRDMTDREIQAIYSETIPDFTALTCDNLTLKDLDLNAIKKLKYLWLKKTGINEIESYSDEKILSDLDLLIGDKLNYACLILLGKSSSINKYLSCNELVFEYRRDEYSIEYQDRVEYKDSFLLFFDKLWEKINTRNEIFQIQEGFIRMNIKSLNEEVIREAILNAVSHRDYKHISSIFIKQNPVSITIESPGGFVSGVTPDNIISVPSTPRNRRLTDILSKIGLVEKSGQGADKIFRESLREGKGLPDYYSSDINWVRLKINSIILDTNFLNYIEKISNDLNINLSVEDLIILEKIRINEKSFFDKKRVERLLGLGVIERVNNSRKLILSQNYYSFIGLKPDYTRKKGLKKETNKQLILKFMTEDNNNRGKMRDFIQLLDGIADKVRIKVLLRELKNEGKIKFIGNPKITNGINVGYWEII